MVVKVLVSAGAVVVNMAVTLLAIADVMIKSLPDAVTGVVVALECVASVFVIGRRVV